MCPVEFVNAEDINAVEGLDGQWLHGAINNLHHY
jgi:hypothetical protein